MTWIVCKAEKPAIGATQTLRQPLVPDDDRSSPYSGPWMRNLVGWSRRRLHDSPFDINMSALRLGGFQKFLSPVLGRVPDRRRVGTLLRLVRQLLHQA
jgi:hypothetical protein